MKVSGVHLTRTDLHNIAANYNSVYVQWHY